MKLVRFLLVFLVMCSIAAAPRSVLATDNPQEGIVIAQVQAGASTVASQEYVSIYNNTDTDVDLTNWCLRYNGSNSKPGCIVSPDPQTILLLRARTYTTFASNEFITAHPGFVPQAKPGFSGGMSDSAGTITLVDSGGTVHDQFAWTSKVGVGKIFQRRTSAAVGVLENTDNNASDFAQLALVVPTNLGLYEQAVPIDLCPNLTGQQDSVPAGYEQDQSGYCEQDVCVNIEGLQVALPEGYIQDALSLCMLIPLENATLHITEILPNATGSDAGKEFIELYNPNDHPIHLHGYVIAFGPDFTKSYALPDVTIQPTQYGVFSDAQMGFVLPNTSMTLRLISPKGEVVSASDTYTDPLDDWAWVLIDGAWQFIDNPTPGAANVPMTPEDLANSPAGDTVSPCPVGKYRNPETNRCRTIEKVVSSAAPCDEDEYRNPETNRCRKLGALTGSSPAACKIGQERNPATNRCRALATESDSATAACNEGQERNPETNRCKKASGATQVSQQPPTQTSGSANIGLITGVAFVTLCYGLYEYRYDAINLYLRLRQGILNRKPS